MGKWISFIGKRLHNLLDIFLPEGKKRTPNIERPTSNFEWEKGRTRDG